MSVQLLNIKVNHSGKSFILIVATKEIPYYYLITFLSLSVQVFAYPFNHSAIMKDIIRIKLDKIHAMQAITDIYTQYLSEALYNFI